MIRHFLAEKNEPILDFLERELQIQTEESLKLLKFGAVFLNKSRQLRPTNLQQGDYLRVHTEPRRFPVEQIDWLDTLLFENEDFIVINKPAGIPTHATVGNLYENVLEQMKTALGIELCVLNRLDVATSGLLPFAKTKEFQVLFNNQLRDGLVTKHYTAVVENHYSSPRHLVHFMKNDFTQPKILSDLEQDGYLKCELEILDNEIISFQDSPASRLKINLLTGRTHQIRSQLSFVGHPVIGDRLYGSRYPWNEKEEVMLTSSYLRFQTNRPFEFKLKN